MTQGEFDKEDVVWTVLYILAAAVSVGIATVELFGVHFSDPVYSIGGSFGDITIAMTISVLILTWVYLTNDNRSLGDMSNEYRYAVLITFLLVITIPTIPQVHDLVTSNDLFSLTAIGLQSVGYAAISYLG